MNLRRADCFLLIADQACGAYSGFRRPLSIRHLRSLCQTPRLLFFPSSMSVRCNPAIYFSAKQAPSSASATRTPPTFASPRYHQMLRRLATLST